jgi:zinc D-Ala-D-Ala carboxypeptidase
VRDSDYHLLLLLGVLLLLLAGCSGFGKNENEMKIVKDPNDLKVLVNKMVKLPDEYEPEDLVYADVHFFAEQKSEKTKLRKVAASALEQLFTGAAEDGVILAGVSGYRSSASQKRLYTNYVKRDGKEAADRFSAKPGHSEHQTSLAVDVSGRSGKCTLMYCFSETSEGQWLFKHAHEYGFILRYPEGKEEVTGYRHEPWHLRYVGREEAREIYKEDSTLEEYYKENMD